MELAAETLGKTMGSAVEHDFLTLLPELARRIRSHGDHVARRHRMAWAQLMVRDQLLNSFQQRVQ
jgi:hypothetical protein